MTINVNFMTRAQRAYDYFMSRAQRANDYMYCITIRPQFLHFPFASNPFL
jgi:hypothetical protein